MIPRRQKLLQWTNHAKAKMHFYKLSESRVRHVLHAPKRIEEGVAPRTIAMMAPASVKTSMGRMAQRLSLGGDQEIAPKNKETWTQEIWVMVQDNERGRTVISAWRYPGMTRPKDQVSLDAMRKEYNSFIKGSE